MMTPADSLLYEYSVVRFVPRVDREEFINIGLLMVCKRQKWLKGEINLNSDKIFSLAPSTNLEALQKQLEFFLRHDVPSKDLAVEEKYRWLASVKSAIIQTSPSHPGIIINKDPHTQFNELLNKEFNRLFAALVL